MSTAATTFSACRRPTTFDRDPARQTRTGRHIGRAMTEGPRYITEDEPEGPTFSVCALVRSPEKYALLLASFDRLGFSPATTEHLAADNRDGNRFDGYSWQRALLAQARGRFVIFCHDDIELIEHGHDDLVAALDDLTARDPAWRLAGVAGGRYRPDKHHRRFLRMRISDPYGKDRQLGVVPGRVETLDECFILMRRARPVITSYDLSGFHFYGPDLCLQAELLGGSAYAIDFHLRHYGGGKKDEDFTDCRDRFIAKYGRIFPGRWLHCTTGVVHLGAPDRPEV